jgi:outer membrane immunogenic protein
MRSILLASILLLGLAPAVMAQAAPAMAQVSSSGDVAFTYHWLRTNTSPGECGCFDLNGGGISSSWNVRPRWALVAEVSSEYAGNVLSTGNSLTLISYLAGARYRLPQPWLRGHHSPQPFAQLLLGAGHAGGGVAGTADGAYAFVTRMGGGIDVPLNPRVAVRMIQVDYNLSRYTNATNDHQNNLLLGAGVVLHWSRPKKPFGN